MPGENNKVSCTITLVNGVNKSGLDGQENSNKDMQKALTRRTRNEEELAVKLENKERVTVSRVKLKKLKRKWSHL